MDPEANLKEQLELARQIVAAAERDVPWNSETEFGGDSDKWGDEQDRSEYFEARSDELAVLGTRLAELVTTLDEWRRKGGWAAERVYVVVWTGDIETNGQAYRTEEAARRDYGDCIEDEDGNTYLIESTVQD